MSIAKRRGRPRTLPVDEQRQQIVHSARGVFARYGFAGASIDAIAREAGIGRATVYEFFNGKEPLFDAVVGDAVERARDRLSEGLKGTTGLSLPAMVRRCYEVTFELVQDDPDLVAVLLLAERSGRESPHQARGQLTKEIGELIRLRYQDGGIVIGQAAEILAAMYVAMGETLAFRQPRETGWDREALIDLLTEFTMGGSLRLGTTALDVLTNADAVRHDGRRGRGVGQPPA